MVALGFRGSSADIAALAGVESTQRRFFILYPVPISVLEFIRHGGAFVDPLGLPMYVWGYLQYRWSGLYRT